MGRSFEQDVADVALVQDGDGEAWLRIVAEYSPNLWKVARQFREDIPADQGFELAVSALGEWVMSATARDAAYLRRNVRFVAQDALNAHLNGDIPAKTLHRLQQARLAVLERTGDVSEPDRLTVREAAVQFEVDLQRLLTFLGLHPESAVSLDAAFESAVDPEGVEYAFFDDAVPAELDVEVCNETFVSDLDVRQSEDVSDLSGRQARVAHFMDHLSDRQRELAGFLMNGMSQREAAAAMGVSPGAVSTHMKSLRAAALVAMPEFGD